MLIYVHKEDQSISEFSSRFCSTSLLVLLIKSLLDSNNTVLSSIWKTSFHEQVIFRSQVNTLFFISHLLFSIKFLYLDLKGFPNLYLLNVRNFIFIIAKIFVKYWSCLKFIVLMNKILFFIIIYTKFIDSFLKNFSKLRIVKFLFDIRIRLVNVPVLY